MKITAIKATPVNIPMEIPYFWSVGLYPGTSKAIVEVETDEGLVGLGEAPSADCTEVINHHLGPQLIGMDPMDIAACELKCLPAWMVVQNTDDPTVVKNWGAIEMALWDIKGKALDQPLYKLLGGAYRKEIPFTEYFAYRIEQDGKGGEQTPEAIADYCQQMAEEHGATMFEGKLSGLADPELEVDCVKAIRERIGRKAMLRLDANMAWSLPTAKYILREIEQYNIRNYEDPVATFEEMAELRKHSAIPFSSHVPDIRRGYQLGVPNAFVCNFPVLGGITRAVRFIGACEAMGINFWCYSGDAGVCTAAYLHMVAAQPWVYEPSQSLFRWQTVDVIENGPFRQKNNVIPVPEGPGLGVKLDKDAFAYCHKLYVDNGPVNHFVNPLTPGRMTTLPLA